MSQFKPVPEVTEEKKLISAGFTKAEVERIEKMAKESKLSVAALVRQMVIFCLNSPS